MWLDQAPSNPVKHQSCSEQGMARNLHIFMRLPGHGLEETKDGGFTTTLGNLFECLKCSRVEYIFPTI